MDEPCIGIDLGTTNSEVAALVGDRVIVLGSEGRTVLPSCVGLAASGELLVGQPALNQRLLYPDRTIASVKRRMGLPERIEMDDRALLPQEVSAVILRQLADLASQELGRPVRRAVITVPAYFSDSQRNATREAGAIAGLEVVRMLNEPTAASLAYVPAADAGERTLLVYDLGGGTFDVSIVTMEGEVTEVLATHGDNFLGGDDFDQILLEHVGDFLRERHQVELADLEAASRSRLWRAVEAAKRRLSEASAATLREESLAVEGAGDTGRFDLELEIQREEFEDSIRPLIEGTLDSVARALRDAGKQSGDIDDVLLVGGSTRIPLVREELERRTGLKPRTDLDPDLCVALGAGVMAARSAGHEVDRVLVDVTSYSFGTRCLDERDGRQDDDCYSIVIPRGAALPVTRTENFWTDYPFQDSVLVSAYQGEHEVASRNLHLGEFMLEGITQQEDQVRVQCGMSLDLDGILKVEGIEPDTGHSGHITISGVMQKLSDEELTTARDRVAELFTRRGSDLGAALRPVLGPDAGESPSVLVTRAGEPAPATATAAAPHTPADRERRILERARAALATMHDEDREEAERLCEQLDEALTGGATAVAAASAADLEELLFFVEG